MTTENDLRDQAEDLLLAHGAIPTPELLDGVEGLAEAAGFEIGGRLLGDLIAKLAPADQAKWLRVMDTGPSLSEASAAIGISKVSLHKQEQRLRRRLTIATRVEDEYINHDTPPGDSRPDKVPTRPPGRHQAGRTRPRARARDAEPR